MQFYRFSELTTEEYGFLEITNETYMKEIKLGYFSYRPKNGPTHLC